MPLIHHNELQQEIEVSEQAAEIFTTVPQVPWKRGPLRSKKPTAVKHVPAGDNTKTPSKED